MHPPPNSTVGRAFVLHAEDLDSILYIPCGPPAQPGVSQKYPSGLAQQLKREEEKEKGGGGREEKNYMCSFLFHFNIKEMVFS